MDPELLISVTLLRVIEGLTKSRQLPVFFMDDLKLQSGAILRVSHL